MCEPPYVPTNPLIVFPQLATLYNTWSESWQELFGVGLKSKTIDFIATMDAKITRILQGGQRGMRRGGGGYTGLRGASLFVSRRAKFRISLTCSAGMEASSISERSVHTERERHKKPRNDSRGLMSWRVYLSVKIVFL